MKKTYYQYSPYTKEFIGAVELTDPIPDATEKKPPAKEDNKTPVWDGSKWVQTFDFRGQYTWRKDNSSIRFQLTQFGDIPVDYTLIPPDNDLQVFDKGKWKDSKELKDARDASLKDKADKLLLAKRRAVWATDVTVDKNEFFFEEVVLAFLFGSDKIKTKTGDEVELNDKLKGKISKQIAQRLDDAGKVL